MSVAGAELTNKIPKGEVAHAGRYLQHPIWGNTPTSYEPDAIDLTVYDEMRRTDETIKAGLQFIKLTVVGKLGEYQHPDDKVKDFVDTAFKMMRGTIGGVVGDFLSSMWAGFAVGELVYDILPRGTWKGKAYLSKVKVLHPLSVWPNGIKSDGMGNVEKVVQDDGKEDSATLGKGKFALLTFDGGGSAFGSPYGSSALRCVHELWFVKNLVQKLYYMYLEKLSVPLIFARVPTGTVICPIHGVAEDYTTAMLDMLSAWNTKTEIVVPAAVDLKTGEYLTDLPSLELMSPAPTNAEGFLNFLAYVAVKILLGLLVPSLTLTEAKFGTRAQAGIHLAAFFSMVEDIQRMVSEFLVEQIVRPMLDLNFAEMDDYGEWVTEPLSEEDKEKLAGNLYKMMTVGAMDAAAKEVKDWVRSKFAPDMEEPEEAEEVVPPEVPTPPQAKPEAPPVQEKPTPEPNEEPVA